MDLEFLRYEFYGNEVRHWLVALGAAALAWIAFAILRRSGARYLRKIAATTGTYWDDFIVEEIGKTKGFVLLAVSVWVGAYSLALPEKIDKAIRSVVVAAVVFQAALWGSRVLSHWIRAAARKSAEGEERESVGRSASFSAVEFLAKALLWSVLALLALDNLGVDITSLVAGLGIGGIAVALAVQNILGDLLCSISIALDKPFEVGDFIVVGDKAGTVERVGIKTTRLTSLQGEQLVFPNASLVGNVVQNFKRMRERRIVFSVGVTYNTSAEKVEAIPDMVREIFDGIGKARLDRAHFKGFGDSSLTFEIVYYVLSGDYNEYMDLQQLVNLALLRRFAKEGVDFAFPTRTVFVNKASA